MAQNTPKPLMPAYKFAKAAGRDKYLDLVDNSAPFYRTEILPGKDDFLSKIAFTFTAVQPTGTLYFRHNIEVHKLLHLLHMMRWCMTGDPTRDGELLGFPDYKGSPDKAHAEWAYTSRTLSVKYVTAINGTALRTGPAYSFQFSYGEGRAHMDNGKPGIVKPANNGTNKSASIMLPIYGNKDNPPSAQYFVEQAEYYLRYQRPIAQMLRMTSSIDNLRWAAQTDPEARMRYEALYAVTRRPEAQQAPLSQEQAQAGYQNLVNQQANDAYEGSQHYEQAPGYQQAPPPDGYYPSE